MGISVFYSVALPYSSDPSLGTRFPGIEVTIYGPEGSDTTIAHIDTGADYCYFDGERYQGLGINLHSGVRQRLITASRHETEFYLHEVELEFLKQRVPVTVGFSTRSMRREILGRNGFLEYVQLGIRERHETVLIEPKP